MTNTMKRLAVLLIGTLFVLCVAIVLAVSLPVSTAFAAEETATDTESEATVHNHTDGTWTELTADGGTLQSGNYYLAGDVTLSTDITIADNATVTLCLNGHMLIGTGTGSVITVGAGKSFTLEDCQSASDAAECQHKYYVAESGLWTFYDGDLPEAAPEGAETGVVAGGIITGGSAVQGGVHVNGTFIMTCGTISGNSAYDSGGGVYVVNGGTFTMTGGTISGNTTVNYGGGGVNVSFGTFTMTGGTISDNTAKTFGGGVDVEFGTFTMTGGTISDNMATYFGSCVYENGGTVSISGGYLDGTIDGSTVSISGGYFSETPNAAHLAEGRGAYDISALGGAAFDSDYIEGYPYAVYVKGVISISTEENIVYDGSPVAEGVDFTVEGADGVTLTYSFKTVGGDEFTAGLPTNAGKYTVSGYGLNREKQFISVEFTITIAKATYDMSNISFEDVSVTYNGEAQSLAISGDLPDGVTVTYEGNGNTNVGEYNVTASFTGDYANYNEINDMTAKLTITKADYDMSGITFADDSVLYNGEEQSLAISGTLPAGVTVTYEGNGKIAAGTYTITAKFAVGNDNYNAIPDMTATLTIEKGVPSYTAPTELTVSVGQNVADITLPDGWEWKDGDVQFGTAGEHKAIAVYTAADTANYAPVEVELTVTVSESEPTEPDQPDGEITTEEPEGLSGGAIAGIVIGCMLGVLLIEYGVCALLYKKKLISGAFFNKIYPFIK